MPESITSHSLSGLDLQQPSEEPGDSKSLADEPSEEVREMSCEKRESYIIRIPNPGNSQLISQMNDSADEKMWKEHCSNENPETDHQMNYIGNTHCKKLLLSHTGRKTILFPHLPDFY